MAKNWSSNNELEFKDIVLLHLKKILELSTTEFTKGYKKEVQGATTMEFVYVPSTIKAYIQAVEHLAYILIPHFDDKTKNYFKSYRKTKKEVEKKVLDLDIDLEDDKNKVDFQISKFKSDDKKKNIINNCHLENAEDLFVELNHLLKEEDYLHGAIFGEGIETSGDDDAVIEGGEDGEV